MYSKVLAVLFLAVFAVIFAEDCSKKFKQDDVHVKVSEECTNKLKITDKDMPQNETEFTKTYDDKVSKYRRMKKI